MHIDAVMCILKFYLKNLKRNLYFLHWQIAGGNQHIFLAANVLNMCNCTLHCISLLFYWNRVPLSSAYTITTFWLYTNDYLHIGGFVHVVIGFFYRIPDEFTADIISVVFGQRYSFDNCHWSLLMQSSHASINI